MSGLRYVFEIRGERPPAIMDERFDALFNAVPGCMEAPMSDLMIWRAAGCPMPYREAAALLRRVSQDFDDSGLKRDGACGNAGSQWYSFVAFDDEATSAEGANAPEIKP